MPLYTYTSVRKDGTRTNGTREAPDRLALFSELRKEGEMVVSVTEAGKGVSIPSFLARFGTISMQDKIAFTRNLSAMIQAGLPLSRALSILERQTRNPKFKQVLAAVGADIQKGTPLYTALGKFPRIFSPLLISMVHAGEETGGLPQALAVVGTQMEKSYALSKRIRGALIYPSIVLSVMVGIAVLMLIYVVPTLSATFAELGVELPATTKTVLDISAFLVNNTFLALLLFVSFGVLLLYTLRTRVGKRISHYVVTRIPIIGTIVIETNAARTARTLSSLFSAGVSALQSLEITKDVLQNVYYREVVDQASLLVEKGLPLSDAFMRHPELYPVLFAEMIAVGEETGQHAAMLMRVAEFYEGEVEQKTKDVSTIVEPFLMVFIGAGVGFFALAMISPIYSISGGI